MRARFWELIAPTIKILNGAPPSIKVSPFLKEGIFVPAVVFAPFFLCFVPPGTWSQVDAETLPLLAWLLALVFLLSCGLVLSPSSGSYLLPVAYGLVSFTPLAFASIYGEAEVCLALAVSYLAAGVLADQSWPWAWALALVAVPVGMMFGMPIAVVLAASAKVPLDAIYLADYSKRDRYGLMRRWSTVGALFYTVTYSSVRNYQPGLTGGVSHLIVLCATALIAGCGYVLRSEKMVDRPSSSCWNLSCPIISVLVLGIGRGALLPHVLGARLIEGGFPAQVAGIVTIVALVSEFLGLSATCCGVFFGLPAEQILAVGLVVTGVHLQVVCALTGNNWLFVLPVSAVLQGIAHALVGVAVPRLAVEHGGAKILGLLSSIELLGTAAAVLVYPQVIVWAGNSFAYQLAADLLIVSGILSFLLRANGPMTPIFSSRMPRKGTMSAPSESSLDLNP